MPHQADHHLAHRHDVWGDDREEVRASEVVEEFASDEAVQRRWHEHPRWLPSRSSGASSAAAGSGSPSPSRGSPSSSPASRCSSSPGPGILVIIAGLAILATEYVWAQRLLSKAKEKAEQAKDAVLGKKKDATASRAAATAPRPRLAAEPHPDRHLSWTDPTLVKDGNFYPPGAKTAEKRLRFYASQFPLVEVDSTYYFPPSEKNSVLWIERTPADFTFNIKAYSLLTNHPTQPESLYKDLQRGAPRGADARSGASTARSSPTRSVDEVWERFRDALMPLHSAGKLGAVLFQFPQWFVISRKNKAYIEECAERLPDYRVAVEFRHKTWMEERNVEETLSFLEEREPAATCASTCPRGSTRASRRSPRRPPTISRWCASTGAIRRRGRPRARRATERFRYDYSQEELAEWVPRIEGLAARRARRTC